MSLQDACESLGIIPTLRSAEGSGGETHGQVEPLADPFHEESMAVLRAWVLNLELYLMLHRFDHPRKVIRIKERGRALARLQQDSHGVEDPWREKLLLVQEQDAIGVFGSDEEHRLPQYPNERSHPEPFAHPHFIAPDPTQPCRKTERSAFPVAIGKHTRVSQSNLTGRRYFIVRTCPQNISVSYSASISYTFVNSNDDHLSCDKMGQPQVYLFLTALWSMTLGLRVVSRLWQRRYAVLLHQIMSVVTIMQTIYC